MNNPFKFIDPWGEKDFYIEGGGEAPEEPEVVGDPSYEGYGRITIPTTMGDVTIDLDTDENWNTVKIKGKQNYIKDKFKELEMKRRASSSAGKKNVPHPSRFAGGNYYQRGWHPMFSIGVEFSFGTAIGPGYGFGIGFVIDSYGNSEAYVMEQICTAGFQYGSADASFFASSLSAEEIANSSSFTAEGSVTGGSVIPFGINSQLSGPVGGGMPNKFNLGASFGIAPIGWADWYTQTHLL